MTESPPEHYYKPSRMWYALAAVLMLLSLGVFVGTLVAKSAAINGRITNMPRFVGPNPGGSVVELTEPGQFIVYHENLGTLDGRSFDTPRRQVWPTFASPAMTCEVVDLATGKPVELRLPGHTDKPKDKREVNSDLVPAYDTAGRQGHGVWVFDVDRPGRYRVTLAYVPEVELSIEQVEVPPPLTKAMQAEMISVDGKAYEQARRAAEEKRELARLEPVDVLMAVGQDPSRGAFFEVMGLKGAAAVLAFGFTAASLIALVTLMLRGGHVTRRGELTEAQRGLIGS